MLIHAYTLLFPEAVNKQLHNSLKKWVAVFQALQTSVDQAEWKATTGRYP
jgi:hypothetical protein